MQQSKQRFGTGMKSAAPRRGWMLPSVLSAVLILLAAVGAPLSQVLRVAEVAPSAATQSEERTAPQYTLVFASALETPAPSQAKIAEKKDAPAKQKHNDVRLLKILDEQWESTARVQIDADIPLAPALIFTGDETPVVVSVNTPQLVYHEFSPPNPPARGPPL